MGDPVQEYLSDCYRIHSTQGAQDERSFYSPLSNLLNAVGKTLDPQVTCIMELKNYGAGLPDGGLFTPEQVGRSLDRPRMMRQVPSRGVIECKPPSEDIVSIAGGKQVTKYWRKYRKVLVTNFRDFLLVTEDERGNQLVHEGFSLASDELQFWQLLQHPKKAAASKAKDLVRFLRLAFEQGASITSPDVLAADLALYAQEALDRIAQSPLKYFESIRAVLRDSLGLAFSDQQGERFFRSSLVQTLFYGVFSAWVLWARKQGLYKPSRPFDWRTALSYLQLPVFRKLFKEVYEPPELRKLRIEETLDWAGETLNRVNWGLFFETFDSEHAVEYFYEPFLAAFDPRLRKDMGVYFTPKEIVKYMVARVDRVLKDELGVENGFADENVYVLDPCCGTGTFLVEVLRAILKQYGGAGADGADRVHVKEAALRRVYGFEILPASFVVAHLRLNLLLRDEIGAPLDEKTEERAAVYLTNALTGWSAQQEAEIGMIEFREERKVSQRVKRERPILVVLGNPPYSAYAGASPDEEGGLVEPYKGAYTDHRGKRRYRLSDDPTAGGWGIRKFNLDDLYVRFFRVAQRRIAEQTGRGIVCFISNSSWVSDPSFVILRESLLETFDEFWIENMHGDRTISERAPDGNTSQTVFAIPGLTLGIKQGVAVSLWIKRGQEHVAARVFHRDDLTEADAVQRRAHLLATLDEPSFREHYVEALPSKEDRFSFRPRSYSEEYMSWPGLPELCAMPPSNGLMEKRGGALIDIDRDKLAERMKAYFDPKVGWDGLKDFDSGLTKKAAAFEPESVRARARETSSYEESRLVRYLVRPFDMRWCYYSELPSLWNRCRPVLWEQVWEGNAFLMSRPAGVAQPEGTPFYWTTRLADNDAQRGHAYYFPMLIRSSTTNPNNKGNRRRAPANSNQTHLEQATGPAYSTTANLSQSARAYLRSLKLPDPDADTDTAKLIWWHALAIGYSPAYLSENADGIAGDWPRIPLPASKKALLDSAALGMQVAALIDPEAWVEGVSTGPNVIPDIKVIGRIYRREKYLEFEAHQMFRLTANWGYLDSRGAVMPATGRLKLRDYKADERAAMLGGSERHHIKEKQLFELLGHKTYDAWMNEEELWTNIPEKVWGFYIGGFQVIKKWLSYRDERILKRPMTMSEAEEVRAMARRITALILLQPQLDASYLRCKAKPYTSH